jgi:dihydropteroate synthase
VEAALEAGARVVNDVGGLGVPAMVDAVRRHGALAIAMHMRGTPRTMQADTSWRDLVGEVAAWLDARARAAVAAGIPAENLAIDPGVGFGKAPADNPRLVGAVPTFVALGWPVAIGASRKRFIGDLTGVSCAADRVNGSVGAALAAVEGGASVVRVHDVRATREALTVYLACRRAG